MILWEQGALDSLYDAKRALDAAIETYEEAQYSSEELSLDDGHLFETLDHMGTAVEELKTVRKLLTPHDPDTSV